MTTAPPFDERIPATASDTVEFISMSHLNRSTELEPVATRGVEVDYFKRYVAALEEAGFDYTLLPYVSSSADSVVVAAAVGQLSSRIRPIVAVRPNTAHPLVVAQQLATIDQLTEGRAVIHLIAGGSDAEQASQGDYVPKDRRYDRVSEYIDVLRRAWTERERPFSHAGEFYRFDDFGPGFAPYGDTIPVSMGGQSDAAFAVGGAKADVYGFWGEPLAEIRKEIDRIHAVVAAAGRTERPRVWVTFRPIVAKTDELAWRKASDHVERLARTFEDGRYVAGRFGRKLVEQRPQNVGSQRALAFAEKADVYDRALWTRTAAVTGAGGASTALVGSPETVAAAILDYVDQGASLVSVRGYDQLADAVDYGRLVLPLVRQELAHRRATARRGALQREHLGALDPDFAIAPATARG